MTKQDLTTIMSTLAPTVSVVKDFGLDIVKSDTDVTKKDLMVQSVF